MKTNGKNICAALKQVRKRVADTNGIVYAPKECHFEDEDVTGMISPDTTSDKQGQKNTKRKRKVRMVTKFVPPTNK
mgnify:CR=1 FL=1